MNDQRVIARASFRAVDLLDRREIGRVAAEPVDGLGGERDEAAAAQNLERLIDRDAIDR
jgi:hypothetical protein